MAEQPEQLAEPSTDAGRNRRRRWVIGVGAGAGVLVVATVVVGTLTRGFGLGRPDHRAESIERCVAAVRAELADRSAGRFENLDARSDIVTEDDHVRLMFDAPKVVSMWAVYGSVQVPTRSGHATKADFTCRAAYFADGSVRIFDQHWGSEMQGLFAR